MVSCWDSVTFGLVILFLSQTCGQKILSEKKKCADPQCESLMMRVQAHKDYRGPDCRYLNFRAGEEINVYYKLTGKREDLWQGSKGKSYGFFPRDTVHVEEVYLTQEVEVPAQEIDFVCLNGGEYIFENEDSILHKYDESDHLNKDSAVAEQETVKVQGQGVYGNAKIDANLQASEQDLTEQNEQEKSNWAVSGIAGWFGIGKAENKESFETDVELEKEEIFRTRRITVNEDIILKESEDEQPEDYSWLGGHFKQFLSFGGKEAEAEMASGSHIPIGESGIIEDEKVGKTDKDNGVQISNNKNINKDADSASDTKEIEESVQDKETEDVDPQSRWFNFGIKNILGFGDKNENKEEENEKKVEETDKQNPTKMLNSNKDDSSDENIHRDKVDVNDLDAPHHDELNYNTDSSPEIHPEAITITKAPEKGGSDDSEASNDFIDKILPEEKGLTHDNYDIESADGKSEQDIILQSIDESVSVLIPASENIPVSTPWYKSVFTNFIHFEESTSVDVRPINDQAESKTDISLSQNSESDLLVKESRDLVESDTDKVKDYVVTTIVKDNVQGPFSEIVPNHMEKSMEELPAAESSVHAQVPDNMGGKEVEETGIYHENDYVNAYYHYAGSSQEHNVLKNRFETKDDTEPMIQHSIMDDRSTSVDIIGHKHEDIKSIKDSPQQMTKEDKMALIEKESETNKKGNQGSKENSLNVDSDQENGTSEIEESILEDVSEAKHQPDSKSKWFNFGIKSILGFGNRNELKYQVHQKVEKTVINKPSANELEGEQGAHQSIEQAGKQESNNVNLYEGDPTNTNSQNELSIDTGKDDGPIYDSQSSQHMHSKGIVLSQIEENRHKSQNIDMLEDIVISAESDYSVKTNIISNLQDDSVLEMNSQSKGEKQKPIVQHRIHSVEDISILNDENIAELGALKNKHEGSKIDNQKNIVKAQSGSTKELDNPTLNIGPIYSDGSHLKLEDAVNIGKIDEDKLEKEQKVFDLKGHRGDSNEEIITLRSMDKVAKINTFDKTGKNEKHKEDSQISFMEEPMLSTLSSVEILSEMFVTNKKDISVDTTDISLERTPLEGTVHGNGNIKDEAKAKYTEGSPRVGTKEQSTLKGSVEELSQAGFDELFTDKETLDLHLKHTNHYDTKLDAILGMTLASSPLSFLDEIHLWETAKSVIVSIYTRVGVPDLSPVTTIIYKDLVNSFSLRCGCVKMQLREKECTKSRNVREFARTPTEDVQSHGVERAGNSSLLGSVLVLGTNTQTKTSGTALT